MRPVVELLWPLIIIIIIIIVSETVHDRDVVTKDY